MMFPKFRTLENAVLLKLYKIIREEGFEGWDDGQFMQNLFKFKVKESYAKRIFKQVIDSGHVSREKEEGTGGIYYTLTGSGIKHVEEMLDNDSSEIFRLNRDGIDNIFGEEAESSRENTETGAASPQNNDSGADSYLNFKRALLVVLAARDEREGPGYRDIKSIADEAKLKYKEGWIQKAAGDFERNAYVNLDTLMGGDIDGGFSAELTGLGLATAETLKGRDSLEVSSSNTRSIVPASDRIVPLNHNKTEYKETIKAIDAVIEAVRGDNEYGARDPGDKARNLIQLEAGRKLLDAITASVKIVEGLLIKTLAYLAGIGVAVSQVVDAIEKVKLLLGL